MAGKQPNVPIIFGDDIGYWNVSFNSHGQMGYETPNIDRIGKEGVGFTDFYGQQSCTAGRSTFITGQNPIRTGLSKVGIPGTNVGLSPEDPTIAMNTCLVEAQIADYVKFPPRQKPTSYNLDQVLAKLNAGVAATAAAAKTKPQQPEPVGAR